MKDIKDYDRKFEVWVDKQIVGVEPETIIVDIPAGEDANEICEDAWHTLISNEIDSGWQEIEE